MQRKKEKNKIKKFLTFLFCVFAGTLLCFPVYAAECQLEIVNKDLDGVSVDVYQVTYSDGTLCEAFEGCGINIRELKTSSQLKEASETLYKWVKRKRIGSQDETFYDGQNISFDLDSGTYLVCDTVNGEYFNPFLVALPQKNGSTHVTASLKLNQSTETTEETTSVETTSGETTSGETTSGETTSGETTSGETTSEQTTSEQTTPEETTTDQKPIEKFLEFLGFPVTGDTFQIWPYILILLAAGIVISILFTVRKHRRDDQPVDSEKKHTSNSKKKDSR